jgi:hypothetical protein
MPGQLTRKKENVLERRELSLLSALTGYGKGYARHIIM